MPSASSCVLAHGSLAASDQCNVHVLTAPCASMACIAGSCIRLGAAPGAMPARCMPACYLVLCTHASTHALQQSEPLCRGSRLQATRASGSLLAARSLSWPALSMRDMLASTVYSLSECTCPATRCIRVGCPLTPLASAPSRTHFWISRCAAHHIVLEFAHGAAALLLHGRAEAAQLCAAVSGCAHCSVLAQCTLQSRRCAPLCKV